MAAPERPRNHLSESDGGPLNSRKLKLAVLGRTFLNGLNECHVR